MKALFGLIFIFFASCLLNAQSVISIEEYTKNGYGYDESIYLSWLQERNIDKSNLELNRMRYALDSLAKVLGLKLEDEISVYIDVAQIKKDNLYGLSDLNGKLLYEPNLKYLNNVYKTTLWFIEINGKKGLINPIKNKFLINPEYTNIDLLFIESSDKYDLNKYKVSKDDHIGIVDTLGNEIIPIIYTELEGYKGIYLARKDNKCGFINSQGNLIIPFEYEDCYHFLDNSLAPVQYGDKWGLIDKKNTYVVKPIYDDMFTYQGEILRIRINGKTGFLDKTGKILIEPKYDDADAYYKNNVLRVILDNKMAILDKEGKELCGFKYDTINKFRYPCTQVVIGDKMLNIPA